MFKIYLYTKLYSQLMNYHALISNSDSNKFSKKYFIHKYEIITSFLKNNWNTTKYFYSKVF